MTISAIYQGGIIHTRWKPVRHRLRYRALYFLIDLDELPSLAARLRLFSLSRFNIFGFYERDHCVGLDQPLRPQIEAYMRQAGLAPDGGAIRLLCMPRVLGMVFNPISVYFCYRRDGSMAAVLYEVNNTFGERHSYLIPVKGVDEAARQPVLRHSCAKRFHVSPFMEMAMDYHFRLTVPDERTALTVGADDADGPVLTATFAGNRTELTDKNLYRAFLSHPLLAIQVLGGIHWEALKLWRKGMRPRLHPAPPAEIVTIATLPESAP
jgi:DUF1365 family protein